MLSRTVKYPKLYLDKLKLYADISHFLKDKIYYFFFLWETVFCMYKNSNFTYDGIFNTKALTSNHCIKFSVTPTHYFSKP